MLESVDGPPSTADTQDPLSRLDTHLAALNPFYYRACLASLRTANAGRPGKTRGREFGTLRTCASPRKRGVALMTSGHAARMR
jgi:hypothetical protein